jgi:hypothetical protein
MRDSRVAVGGGGWVMIVSGCADGADMMDGVRVWRMDECELKLFVVVDRHLQHVAVMKCTQIAEKATWQSPSLLFSCHFFTFNPRNHVSPVFLLRCSVTRRRRRCRGAHRCRF